jgi:hypothetical protein
MIKEMTFRQKNAHYRPAFVFERNRNINTVVVRSNASEVRLLQAACHRHPKQDSLKTIKGSSKTQLTTCKGQFFIRVLFKIARKFPSAIQACRMHS